MIRTVRKTIESASLLAKGERLVVAVSGGADSVALLRALVLLSREYGWSLTAAHLNHGIRGGEADRDEAFVHRFCDAQGVRCLSRKLNIRAIAAARRGASLEETAREVRYQWLAEVARDQGAGKIATGHHRDDQAETVLMNLIRGSGIDGLKGILPLRSGLIVRPLLAVDREAILAFLQREGLIFREDATNRDTAFLRNRIRGELIPVLAGGYNPRIVESLCRTAEIVRREDDYLQQEVSRILLRWGIASDRQEITLPLPAFDALHIALRARIVKRLLQEAASPGGRIANRHIEAVLAACAPPERRLTLDLPGGIVVTRSVRTLRIHRKQQPVRRAGSWNHRAEALGFTYPVEVPGVVPIAEIGIRIRFTSETPPDPEELRRSDRTVYLDLDRVVPPLIIRSVRPGDRIEPLGMHGVKKVNELFIDAKIPPETRARIPLLADAQAVLWIAGLRISEHVKVTDRTKKVLKAEMV